MSETETAADPAASRELQVKEFNIDWGSLILAGIFIVYCVGLVAYLRYAVNNDSILGLATYCRKKGASASSIKTWTIIELLVMLLAPIGFAILWATMLETQQEYRTVHILATLMFPLFVQAIIIGFAHWEGNKWQMKWGIAILFAIAVGTAWAFAFALSCLRKTYSYTGYTALLFTLNFIAVCFLTYQKNVWYDLEVKHLFTDVAQKIAKPDYKTIIDQPDYDERAELNNTFEQNRQQSSRFQKCYGLVAFVAYLATLVIYAIVVNIREAEGYKAMGVVIPIFVIFSDLVILSLREKPISVDGKSSVKELEITDIVYDSVFQSFALLLIRFALCFNKYYWLLNFSAIYIFVQLIASFDLSYAIFTTARVMGNEQEEIMRLYSEVPLVQAATRSKSAELHCNFPTQGGGANQVAWRFRTTLAMFLQFLVFAAICYGSTLKNQDGSKTYIESKDITFENTFGQWVIGVFAICIAVVLMMFIIWRQAFEMAHFRISFLNTIIYIVLQAASIGLGVLFYWLVGGLKIDLILTTFILVPIIVVSFMAFYGIWQDNDYCVYESKEGGSLDLFVRDQTISFCGRLQKVNWKPKTRQDWLVAILLLVNFGTIIVYTIVTMMYFKPKYVGFTVGVWIVMIELMIFLARKYQQNNYSFKQFEAVLCLIGIATVFLTWICVMLLKILNKDENKVLWSLTTVCSVIYFLGAIIGLLISELDSKGTELKKLSKSFYVQAGSLLLLMVAIGLYLLMYTEQFTIGVLWLLAIAYLILFIFLEKKFKKYLDIAYAFVFVAIGIFTLLTDFKKTPKIVAVSTFYAGFFLLAFGQFVRVAYENTQSKAQSILLYGRCTLPIFRYDLEQKTMTFSNQEGYLFFAWLVIVQLWGFSATAIAEAEYRYIPIAAMGLSLSVAFIYVMTKVSDITTLDERLFKQANMLFYISCLIAAVENKQQWRNAQLNIEVTGQENSKNKLGPEYLKELNRVKQWRMSLQEFSAQAGYFASFDHTAISAKAKSDSKVAADNQADQTQTPALNEMGEYDMQTESSDIPQGIQDRVQKLRNEQGDSFLDCWLEFVEMARQELLLDQKFWAFLNGYCNLKMNQLLEQQTSIVTQLFTMFLEMKIRDEQAANNDAPAHAAQVKVEPKNGLDFKQLLETKSLTIFVKALQSNLQLRVDFTCYVGTELLKETKDAGASESVAEVELNELLVGAQQGVIVVSEFVQKQLELLDRLVEGRTTSMEARIAEARRLEDERIRKRKEAEEARMREMERQREREREKDKIIIANLEADEQLLQKIGDELYKKQGNNRFVDPQFDERTAKGPDEEGELPTGMKFSPIAKLLKDDQKEVFADGVSACDINQGGLGDCYLLSAMSVIAHNRPELIKKIFHNDSRVYKENGMYHIMFYQGRIPVVITIDDQVFLNSSDEHSFVEVHKNKNGIRELWPILIEKGYAKLFGSYSAIIGGHPDEAMAHLTNALPLRYSFKDDAVKKMYTSGEFWQKCEMMRDQGWLMGAASPAGSDKNKSGLGVVFGHAYSVMDVATVDGNKLLQLRNPWGQSEWKGAWSDNSSEWNQKRKQIVYERMAARGVDKIEIGADDGVFWISLSDFFTHFAVLYAARYFDKSEWTEIYVDNEWTSATAGGCPNFETFPNNPQYKLSVEANSETVEVVMCLSVSQAKEDPCIGFRAYGNRGLRVEEQWAQNEIFKTTIAYREYITHEAKFQTTTDPMTVVLHQFDPKKTANLRFTVWYKHKQGKVTIDKF